MIELLEYQSQLTVIKESDISSKCVDVQQVPVKKDAHNVIPVNANKIKSKLLYSSAAGSRSEDHQDTKQGNSTKTINNSKSTLDNDLQSSYSNITAFDVSKAVASALKLNDVTEHSSDVNINKNSDGKWVPVYSRKHTSKVSRGPQTDQSKNPQIKSLKLHDDIISVGSVLLTVIKESDISSKCVDVQQVPVKKDAHNVIPVNANKIKSKLLYSSAAGSRSEDHEDTKQGNSTKTINNSESTLDNDLLSSYSNITASDVSKAVASALKLNDVTEHSSDVNINKNSDGKWVPVYSRKHTSKVSRGPQVICNGGKTAGKPSTIQGATRRHWLYIGGIEGKVATEHDIKSYIEDIDTLNIFKLKNSILKEVVLPLASAFQLKSCSRKRSIQTSGQKE
ncbi:hypothetical protein HHI36_018302 [Cryptolaemus montrouzieri]|uniref:Uncharacterized protein n=1 Tax=Cryptolaemus montrouzieri TaxID=559131 RepID=A0ABD2NZR8_9CUCU